MIISKLQGGLGNQLFQWAYGKFISTEYNTPLFLDTNSYYNQVNRGFSLNKFSFLKYSILTGSSFQNVENKTHLKMISDNFIFDRIDYKDNCHYYLDGYWQSEKYFYNISNLIKIELRPSDDIISKIKSIKNLDSRSVSLHIRRTDYLTSNGYHPVQSIEYYKKALDIIGEYDYIFVFSDDIQWCKNNLTFNNMIFMEGFDDVEDLWMMSMCKNNIIANSSFSWWGAWLNSNPNKKVIVPNNWFGPQTNLSDADIIPSRWIKI
jgi:hypothetical protein